MAHCGSVIMLCYCTFFSYFKLAGYSRWNCICYLGWAWNRTGSSSWIFSISPETGFLCHPGHRHDHSRSINNKSSFEIGKSLKMLLNRFCLLFKTLNGKNFPFKFSIYLNSIRRLKPVSE